jgi:putative alpha-1,2-mannosidase
MITQVHPYKTQYWVRRAMSTMYNDTPAGQCGNVDCGQMAAWYVFSASGILSGESRQRLFMPSAARWSAGPLFIWIVTNTMAAHLPSSPRHNSADNIYIQSATLDGKPLLAKPWLTCEQITSGGTLKSGDGAETQS